ncbi:hypothetical protein [Mycolicibacterium tusciae]|uniref:hypothetical protein n=1 Tax=Mycolicibacterium tusciae TaxID=75922 RepID=UPI00024A3B55|nr:hypothetical protein [Mycolicibacterium tusciae]
MASARTWGWLSIADLAAGCEETEQSAFEVNSRWSPYRFRERPCHRDDGVMLALGVGLGLLRSIDPSVSVNGLVDVLRLVSGQT